MQQGTGSPRSDPAQISASQLSRRAAFTARCAHESTPKATGATSSSEPHKGEAAATNTEGTRTSALTRKRAQAAIHRPRATVACPFRTASCIRFTRETPLFQIADKGIVPMSLPAIRSRPTIDQHRPLDGKPVECRQRPPAVASTRCAGCSGCTRQHRAARRGTAPHPHAQPRGSLTPWCPWANAA